MKKQRRISSVNSMVFLSFNFLETAIPRRIPYKQYLDCFLNRPSNWCQEKVKNFIFPDFMRAFFKTFREVCTGRSSINSAMAGFL